MFTSHDIIICLTDAMQKEVPAVFIQFSLLNIESLSFCLKVPPLLQQAALFIGQVLLTQSQLPPLLPQELVGLHVSHRLHFIDWRE